MPSSVTQIHPADSASALNYFESHLTFETDCSDVHAAMAKDPDFKILHEDPDFIKILATKPAEKTEDKPASDDE